jgi:hypothetical protein
MLLEWERMRLPLRLQLWGRAPREHAPSEAETLVMPQFEIYESGIASHWDVPLWHTRFVPDPKRKRTRPRDPSQLAKLVFDIASGEVEDTISKDKRHPESVKGRAGGKKGGKARAQHLTPEQRQDIAKLAAQARWKKQP